MNGSAKTTSYLSKSSVKMKLCIFIVLTFVSLPRPFGVVVGFSAALLPCQLIGNLSTCFVWLYATLRDQEPLELILLLLFYFVVYGKIEKWFILLAASFVDCRAFVGWFCVLLCIVRASLFHWTPSFDFTWASLTAPVYYSVNHTAGIYGIERLRPIGKSTSNHYKQEETTRESFVCVNKDSFTTPQQTVTYEDLMLSSPTVYKAFRSAARAIAKCDTTATDYLLKAFKAEVDKERLKLSVSGDWYGKSRDQKIKFPLASNKMTDK